MRSAENVRTCVISAVVRHAVVAKQAVEGLPEDGTNVQ